MSTPDANLGGTKGEISDVAVVGAAGRMGRWFVQYHAKRATVVKALDIKRPSGFEALSNVKVTDSLRECTENSDAIIICAPVTSTPELVHKCAEQAKRGTIIVEISSVKKQAHLALTRIKGDVFPLCLHPMFGPAAGETGLRWILVPVRDRATEMEMAGNLYPSMNIIGVEDWQQHDRAMGIILGLTYAVNLAFADTISNNDLDLLKTLSGTTFAVQSMLSESILGEEPGLIGAVISSNPETWQYMEQFSRSFEDLSQQVQDRDLIMTKAAAVSKRLSQFHSLQKSYELLYKVVALMKQTKN